MDESMNSVHSISAMDISPACSPRSTMNSIPPNYLVQCTFRQQQESLSNILFNAPPVHDYQMINQNPLSDEYDNNSKNHSLFTTVLNENTDEGQSQYPSEASNQLRQRVVTDFAPSVDKPTSTVEQSDLKNLSRRSFNKNILLIPILLLSAYFVSQQLSSTKVLPRSSNWQNATVYLTKHLIGQDQGLDDFKSTLEKHKNFSIVLIEGSIGTGKSYLASSLQKFIPTTLISTNTLLGLSSRHWTESNRLATYLLSSLSPKVFQILILDDLDLLSANETYCQTLATALHSIDNSDKRKNVFILLLQTGTLPDKCQNHFQNMITKSIKFNLLQRHHIRKCVENEAYKQNVQPPLDNEQIEKILDSLEYVNEQGRLYSKTGCKQIPSLVMSASLTNRSVN